jgi:hypothetical protein
MQIHSISKSELATKIKHEGIYLHIGPFTTHIKSSLPAVTEGIYNLYADYEINNETNFADFHVKVEPSKGLRRWFRPQVNFYFDETKPFRPLPISQAFPMFEWCLNWCIANHIHEYLIFHAAVLEKNGKALVMPGPPGSGKSTLCAAMAIHGWRLLSDELTMISLEDGLITPVPRPVSLKNESINVIRKFAPEVIIGRTAYDTNKGDVAHMRPPRESIEKNNERVKPAWLMFPKYRTGAEQSLTPRSKACTLIYAAENSFNYNILGKAGFEAAASFIDQVECFDLTYSDLDKAIARLDKLE